MAARSIASARISLALVSVPVKLFTAASAESPHFHWLHNCGSRLKQATRCEVQGIDVDRSETKRAYEYERDRYVEFTNDELDELEASLAPDVIEIVEFVPRQTIDPLHVEKSVLVAPDAGAEYAFAVLRAAMHGRGVAGLGYFGKRGLVGLRSHGDALVLHELFGAHEIRGTSDIRQLETVPRPRDVELDLAVRLIKHLEREAFAPGRFEDRWTERVKRAVAAKVAGDEVIIPPAKSIRMPLELAEALRLSLEKGPRKAAPRAPRPAKKVAGGARGRRANA